MVEYFTGGSFRPVFGFQSYGRSSGATFSSHWLHFWVTVLPSASGCFPRPPARRLWGCPLPAALGVGPEPFGPFCATDAEGDGAAGQESRRLRKCVASDAWRTRLYGQVTIWLSSSSILVPSVRSVAGRSAAVVQKHLQCTATARRVGEDVPALGHFIANSSLTRNSSDGIISRIVYQSSDCSSSYNKELSFCGQCSAEHPLGAPLRGAFFYTPSPV